MVEWTIFRSIRSLGLRHTRRGLIKRPCDHKLSQFVDRLHGRCPERIVGSLRRIATALGRNARNRHSWLTRSCRESLRLIRTTMLSQTNHQFRGTLPFTRLCPVAENLMGRSAAYCSLPRTVLLAWDNNFRIAPMIRAESRDALRVSCAGRPTRRTPGP